MQPQFVVLFLIAFSAFLHFATAESQAAWETEQQAGIFPQDLWIEVTSLFTPANPADQTQHPTSKHGPIESLFEETNKISHSVETFIDTTVALGITLHNTLMSGSLDGAAALNDPLLTPLLKETVKIISIAREEFRKRFPLPAMAPGHTERMKRMSKVLEHLRRVVVRLARDQGVELEAIERHLTRVESFIRDTLVLIGDLAELYPEAMQALVLNLSTVLLPDGIVLPTLFFLYSLGPHMFGEDGIDGWILKFVSENLRV